jgi:hypothetical protein
MQPPPVADPGVDAVARALRLLGRAVLYTRLAGVERLRGAWLAYLYVGAWIAVLAILLGTSDLWEDGVSEALVVILALVAGYRLLDIVRWWLSLLLDPGHHLVAPAERSLLFAVLNLGETALIGGIWLQATDQSRTAGGALFQAFSLVTQLQLAPATTTWAKAAVASAEVTALVILLGGIAVLVTVISRKIRQGPWAGPGSGPSGSGQDS